MENLALWKRALAEFSAVFLLASIGLMTVATALTTGAYGLFELSIAFGFAITVMVVVSAAVSGGHFNPAITIMLASFRRFPWRDVPVYIAAQISGGVLGALVLYFFFSGPIRAFEAASKRAQQSDDVSSYYEATEIYRGDLLPEDPYEDWTMVRRDSLREEYHRLLLRLAQLLEERQVGLGEAAERAELDHRQHLVLEDDRQHDDVDRVALA